MNLLGYIDNGGIIAYILVFMNVIGFAAMILKFFEIRNAKLNLNQSAAEIRSFVPYELQDELFLVVLNAECDKFVNKLDNGMNLIKNIATIAPLLGLLGTVLGVLQSFESISVHGMSNPSFFSSGISIALITTVAGLIVAIPHYIGYNYFAKELDSLEIELRSKVVQ